MLHSNLSFSFVRNPKIYFSTATGVLITPKHYFIFNVGDSRSILIKDKKLHFSSEDHKPMNDGEKRRIEEAGGRVMIQRINGSLAVSRALGDFEYKQRTDRGKNIRLPSSIGTKFESHWYPFFLFQLIFF